MLKNRFMIGFAFAGLLGLAACGGEENNTEIVEEPVVEEPIAPATEPAPAPMTTDTMGAGMTTDTAVTDTGTTGH